MSRPTPDRGLERARIRIPLIRALAVGELSDAELARRHGVTRPAILKFRRRYAAEIEAQAANLEDKFAALWIAQKERRLGAYQDDVAAIDAAHDTEGAELDPALLAAKHRALRNSAEELGALKTVIDSTVQVRYELVGVDPESLK